MKKDWIKFVLCWLGILAFRLIPFRAPNVEPILAVAMPFAKQYRALGGFLFGTVSILLFDFATGTVGAWTSITAVSYGLVGAGAYLFLKNREPRAKNFMLYGIIGTILYDAATGLTIGPMFFGQPFLAALVGQIPFTLAHLAGTVVFSLALSPAIYRWVVMNKKLETGALVLKFFGVSRV